MKLKNFYLGLSSDDYLIANPIGSDFPYRVSPIVSDFNFLSDYFSHFIEKKLRNLKFETKEIETIMIRGRKNPNGVVVKKHLKTIELEVDFNEKKYLKIYPNVNSYPLNGQLIKLEDELTFSNFLFNMTVDGIDLAKHENVNIPCDDIIKFLKEFREIGFQNEWIFKKKKIQGTSFMAMLKCKLNCNNFILELIVKNNKKVFKKEVLKTLPTAIQYKDEFKDLIIKGDEIIITKMNQSSELYKVELDKILNY